jgi:23S rRNA (guanosine2251-2'-O)-methyltransferase
MNFFYLSGAGITTEFLRFRRHLVKEVFVEAPVPFEAQKVVELAKRVGVQVSFLSKSELRMLLKSPARQGVAVALRPFDYASEDELLSFLEQDKHETIFVALDCIQDPQNLGTIARSAAFFGVRALIVPKDRSAKVTDSVIRASQGAVARLDVVLVTNLQRTLRLLGEHGVFVVGAVASGGVDIASSDLRFPLCVVVGSEHEGLRRLVKERCDILVSILGKSDLDSINVASATSVILYEVSKRARHGPERTS